MAEQQPRRRRVDAGTVRQTARDAVLLEWMSHMYGMPLDLVQLALGMVRGDRDEEKRGKPVTQVRVYQMVRRWDDAGWVHRRKVDAGPMWVWPRRETVRQYLGWDADWSPRPTTTAHARAVAAVRLHQCGLDLHRWISERTLRHEDGGYRKRGQEEPHMPDGIQVLPDGRRVLVEVELTPKNPARYLEENANHFQVTTGLLQRISNRADQLGCQAVAYWCSPAALPVVQRQVGEFRERLRILNQGREDARQWYVRSIQEVPGWTVQRDGE